MLNLMYHYIFPESFKNKFNGIVFTSQEKFREQIIQLKKNYIFIRPEELNELDTHSIQNNFCTITFDDGTKDQFKYALPILNEFKIKAFFFIIGSVLDHKVPNSHLLHFLLNYENEGKILNKINDVFFKNNLNYEEEFKNSSIYNYEKNKNKRILKYIINFKLHDKQKEISNFLKSELANFSEIYELLNNWFANENDIKSAIDDGHYIGNHTYSHNFYGSLENIEIIKNDINKNHKLIKEKFNFITRSYSHPQGGDDGFINKEISVYLKQIGYKSCFKAINSCDFEKMNLPRLDNIYLN